MTINQPTSAPPDAKNIRVLITDDHVVVRKGIRALLMTEPDIEVVGEAENGYQAVAEAERLRPDVILMDMVMPEMDGIEAIRRITARQPKARILVLTSFATDEKVFPAIKAGALGYLLKDSNPEDLVRAIHQVFRRELSLHPTIAQKLLQELALPAEQGPTPEPLTEPEVAMLRLIARGRSNREIAGQLEISETTVHTRLNKILSKLHLASRTEAVLYALQEGLASLADAAPNYISQLLTTLEGSDFVSPAAETYPFGLDRPAVAQVSQANELEALRQIAADYHEIGQELALAGKIQASFLPKALPALVGWQLAATLEPAKETSGDFYDLIPLPAGRLGLLIADVVGKGIGAALYMALSRTLIRTYALQYAAQPGLVLQEVNYRLQTDIQADMFVTVFYGILDPHTSTLTYSSAGHNPPYLFGRQNGTAVQELLRTGIPLGMFPEMSWEEKSVQLAPGDMLLFYTDGVTEAQNQEAICFGQERLLAVVRANLGRPAQIIQEALLRAVHEFVIDTPEAWRDDITVMVLAREA